MRGGWRLAGPLAAAVVLAACAGPAPRPPAPTPSPTSGVAATQTPRVAPAVLGVATETRGYCGCYTLHLLSLGGPQLGSVTLGAGVQPALQAGSQGLYYVLGGQLLRLGAGSAPVAVGTVAGAPPPGASVDPAPEFGALAVASGGTEWAYLQTLSGAAGQSYQLWLGEVSRSPRLLFSATPSAGPPSSEFANGWSYQLLGWAGGAVVLAQIASGSTSFSSAALEVYLVNPETGAQALLSNSQNCPISEVSGDGNYVCFQQGGGQSTELVTGTDGIATGSWALAAGGGYGAAVFDPTASSILFARCPGCGQSPSAAYLNSQMEVLDTASGALRTLGAPGLVPDAWPTTAQVVATQYTRPAYAGSASPTLSEVVLVNPQSGQVAALSHDSSSSFLGIATG